MKLVVDVPDELAVAVAEDTDGDIEAGVVDALRLWIQLRNPEEILAEAPPVPGREADADTDAESREVPSA